MPKIISVDYLANGFAVEKRNVQVEATADFLSPEAMEALSVEFDLAYRKWLKRRGLRDWSIKEWMSCYAKQGEAERNNPNT